jgi:hypothetical protein
MVFLAIPQKIMDGATQSPFMIVIAPDRSPAPSISNIWKMNNEYSIRKVTIFLHESHPGKTNSYIQKGDNNPYFRGKKAAQQ